MIATVAALLAATTPACLPVPGADALWRPATRWVIVGEIHGTIETPEAFANLACLAVQSGRPVTIAVEYSADWQPVIDAYLRSDGKEKARAALLSLPVWHAKLPDGRGSVAFLRMFDRLRQMKQDGEITGVIGSDVGHATPAEQTRNEAMANAWMAIPAPDNGIVLALVGNFHAMRKAAVRPNQTIMTAGSLMPPTRTITINIVGMKGTAWVCEDDGCGVHPVGKPADSRPGILFVANPDYPWTATYELGRPTTAAMPAVPQAAVSRPDAIRLSN